MTADESGLPPLDPETVQLPDYNGQQAIMKWLIQTVLLLPGVTDEQRAELDQVIKDVEFNKMMKNVSLDIVKDLIANKESELDTLLQWLDEHPNDDEEEDDHEEGELPA